MSREIKFRIWSKTYKKMLIPNKLYPLRNAGGTYVTCYDGSKWYDLSKKYIELMQYIDQIDKNGKDVYEGDIVAVRDYIGINGEGYGDKYYASIMWDEANAGFELFEIDRMKGDAIRDEFDINENHCELEVIGNIYENEDLIN